MGTVSYLLQYAIGVVNKTPLAMLLLIKFSSSIFSNLSAYKRLKVCLNPSNQVIFRIHSKNIQ